VHRSEPSRRSLTQGFIPFLYLDWSASWLPVTLDCLVIAFSVELLAPYRATPLNQQTLSPRHILTASVTMSSEDQELMARISQLAGEHSYTKLSARLGTNADTAQARSTVTRTSKPVSLHPTHIPYRVSLGFSSRAEPLTSIMLTQSQAHEVIDEADHIPHEAREVLHWLVTDS
jgi:hypothetical protein